MAVNLLDLAKAYLNDQVVSQVSNTLAESEQKTQTALTGLLPTVLGGIVQKVSEPGGASTILNLIKEITTPSQSTGTTVAPENGVLGQLENLLSGNAGQLNQLLSMGTGIIHSIFGEKEKAVTGAVASYSDIKESSASSLMKLAAPVLLSLIGKKIADEGSGALGLTTLLNSQTSVVQSSVPNRLSSLLGNIPGLGLLSGLAGKLSSMAPAMGDPIPTERVTPPVSRPESVPTYHPQEESTGNRWLPWLLLALGAVALFFVLRSCRNENKGNNSALLPADSLNATVDSMASDASAAIDTAGNKVEAAMDSASESLSDATAKLGAFFKRKLPSGYELNIPELGIENNLVKFIEDKSKPVDKTTWFNFDRLLFDTGKATLKPASQEQVTNIAEILKAFPEVELKLGGYTDNTGSAAVNKKLSQERADAVKAELVKLGIAASRLEAEGYGQEHPVASNDTAEGRAQNRRIAVRVTKK